MGLSKSEVKLRRLLASMHNQDNPRKLVHYVATARELLNVLTGESGHEGLPSISEDKAKEYVERIESFAENLNIDSMPDIWDSMQDDENCSSVEAEIEEVKHQQGGIAAASLQTVRRRHRKFPVDVNSSNREALEWDDGEKEERSSELKVDSDTKATIGKHRRLQDDLADELVDLARQLKESSLLMEKSLHESEKVLDSTEHAVEHSLASTNRAKQRAGEIYSRSFNTGCFTWLLILIMCLLFIFMIALIRVT